MSSLKFLSLLFLAFAFPDNKLSAQHISSNKIRRINAIVNSYVKVKCFSGSLLVAQGK